jgi:sulfate adenylyltransferase subunit 2
MSGKRLSPDQLNQLRVEAVTLRLQKKTLAKISDKTGLSHPTIIDAYNRFLTGGWDAIKTKHRGRPKGSKALEPSNQQQLATTLCSIRPEEIDSECRLWSLPLLQHWLTQSQHLNVTPRTVARYADDWGFNPSALSSTDYQGSPKRWIDEHFPELLKQTRKTRSKVLIGGFTAVESVQPQPSKAQPTPSLPTTEEANKPHRHGHMIYARDLRGKLFWLATPGQVDADLIIDFFRRLMQQSNTKIDLLFKSASLATYPDIQNWLRDHDAELALTAIPLASPKVPAPQMEHPVLGTQAKTEKEHSATPAAPPAHKETPRKIMTLTHLQRLEAESMQIMREVVAEAENPVMLYSVGKDSAVMLHLAMKAFYPSIPPFPLLHVDTTWKFKEMYAFRDQMARELGMDLLVHINPEGLKKEINPFIHGSAIHTDIMKTQGLKQALDKYGFDIAFGGARRDEEKSRAKERIFSFRTEQHRWDPKSQRPEIWKLYNTRKHKGESIRVFPLSNWTELDIWQYIHLESIPIVPLYLAAERPVVERDGALIMVDDERLPLMPGEVPLLKKVRFRTLGCYPLTGAVESEADTLPAIIQEMLLTKTSERQGRMIDHDSAASMEKKKQEGYF